MSETFDVGAGPFTHPGRNGDHEAPASISVAPHHVSIEEGYELWAPIYDLTPNPLLALEARTLPRLLPCIDGRYVLDIACGTGRWLDQLLGQGARGGVGVDASSAMLAVAATKPKLRGRLVRADCLSLPFRSEIADMVVCSFALAHLPDLAAFVAELSRLVKCGADLYVTDVHPEGYKAGWRSSFRLSQGVVEIPTYARSVEQILRAFKAGGFELVDCVEPHFDEADRPIFLEAKKARLFEQVCQLPAVLICHFTRSYGIWPIA